MATKKSVIDALKDWNVKNGGGRRQPHTPALYDALGIEHYGSVIPPEFEGYWFEYTIGTYIRVYPTATKKRLHRCFIVCPECSREVDAGHFYQHKCRKIEPLQNVEVRTISDNCPALGITGTITISDELDIDEAAFERGCRCAYSDIGMLEGFLAAYPGLTESDSMFFDIFAAFHDGYNSATKGSTP